MKTSASSDKWLDESLDGCDERIPGLFHSHQRILLGI